MGKKIAIIAPGTSSLALLAAFIHGQNAAKTQDPRGCDSGQKVEPVRIDYDDETEG